MSLIALLIIIELTFSACPNGCSGHGTCTNEGTCKCFESAGLGINDGVTNLPSFTEPDCSLSIYIFLCFIGTCPQGDSFAAISSSAYTESGILIRSSRELTADECTLNVTSSNSEVISVSQFDGSAVTNRLKFGGTLRCGDSPDNINAITCENSCCLVKYDIHSSEAETETETETDIDKYDTCSFTFQNYDLSLIYALTFNTLVDKNYSATIEDIDEMFEYYGFDEEERKDYTYRFACITNTTTQSVELYYATYKRGTGDKENTVTFTFNSTAAKPAGQCFMIVGCIDDKCTIGNIPLLESQVYINYMYTLDFVYYFGKLSQANKQTGILTDFTANNPKDGKVKIVSKKPTEGTEVELNVKDLPIDKTLRETGTYVRLDVLFGLNINQGLSQLVVGSRIELLKMDGGSGIVKTVYRVRKLEFIDSDGNKVDKYGNILRKCNGICVVTPTTAAAPRLLNERELADGDNNNYIIAVILTSPPLGDLKGNYIYTITKSTNGHVSLECSGAGKCNRQTGQCQCYEGYEGEACERMGCQNKCNNHGRCVAFYELFKDKLQTDDIQNLKDKFGYFGVDTNPKFYGCKCEQGYRGPDCSLRECPSGEDPQKATNIEGNNNGEFRDCSGRGICDYTSGICKCHNGYTGAGCELMLTTM